MIFSCLNLETARYTKSKILPIEVFAIGLLLMVDIILLMPLLIQKGLVFHGDTTYFLYPDSYGNKLQTILSTYTLIGGKIGWSIFAYRIPIWFLEKIVKLPPEFAYKMYITLGLFILNLLVFYAFRNILEFDLFKQKLSDKRIQVLLSLFATLFFCYSPLNNVYNVIINPLSSYGISYCLVPYILYIIVKPLFKKEILTLKDALLYSLLVFVFTTQPIIFYIIAVLLLLSLPFAIGLSRIKQFLINTGIILILTALALMRVLLPTLAGYIFLEPEGIFKTYTTFRLINISNLKLLSFYNLLELLLYSHKSFFFFVNYPSAIYPFNILITAFALLPFFIRKIDKQLRQFTLFLLVIFIFGLFLSKGIHPPLGYLYYLIASSLPLGIGAYLRNPTKFIPLVTLSLTLLLIITLTTCCKKRIHKLLGGIIIIGINFFLLSIYLNAYTYIHFKPTQLPKSWMQVYNFLKDKDGRVLVFPGSGLFIWKEGRVAHTRYDIVTTFPCQYLPLECYSYMELKDILVDLQKLDLLYFKFVILHTDNLKARKIIKQNTSLNLLLSYLHEKSNNKISVYNNSSSQWKIDVFYLNTTPVHILINGIPLPVKSALYRGIFDDYYIKVFLPIKIQRANLSLILPFTYSKNWEIKTTPNIQSKITNYSNILEIQVTNFSYSPPILTIKMQYKLGKFLLIGLSISILTIIILFITWVLSRGRYHI